MRQPSSTLVLLSGALALFVGGAAGQGSAASCVQVSNVAFDPSCPCDAGSKLTFQMEGQTTVVANTVNVAVIIDASGSVSGANFLLEKEFAKDAVASFASRNLFENGGTASFAQFSTSATEGGTFASSEEYDAFVDADPRDSGGTVISTGLAKGRELLGANPATASFLILITDGNSAFSDDPSIEADEARAEGTIVYAVGVGSVSEETLLAIAGDESNYFDIEEFTELDSALDEIISSSAGSIPCAATGATVTVGFNAAVSAAAVDGAAGSSASFAGSEAVFLVPDLEATATSFEVVLDTCGQDEGAPVVASVSYTDDEGNTPDLDSVAAEGGVVPTCDGTTTPAPVPVTVPTPSPVSAPVGDSSYSYSYTFAWFDDDYDYSYDYDDDALMGPGPIPSPTSPMPTGGPSAPAPTGPTPTTPGMTCSNGVYGVESSNGKACCVDKCGSCGGVGCSTIGAPDLGADDCCVTEIVHFGEACSVTGAAPCYIDGDTPPSPTTGPMPSPVAPSPMPAGGPPAPAPAAPTTGGGSPTTGTMCSNGVYGVESSNGKACCVDKCGSCGGSGCSTIGAPDLDADDCCVTEIVHFGEACSVTGAAPCYIDGDAPTTLPAVPAPTPPVATPSPGIPSIGNESPTPDMMCSNGVYGVESALGRVCCVAECGSCGGTGCSTIGAPDLGADDCCVTEILDYGESCSVTGTAPCYIDDGMGWGPSSTWTLGDDDDDSSMSFSFSYSYDMDG